MRAFRSLFTGGSAGLLVAAAAVGARADSPSPEIRASMSCEAASGPGRLRCDVDVRVGEGELRWAEVEVTKVADFLLPLRGRLGPRDASSHELDIFRWSLGLVARDRGTGDVAARVRAVVCRGDRCVPATVLVTGRVVVGK